LTTRAGSCVPRQFAAPNVHAASAAATGRVDHKYSPLYNLPEGETTDFNQFTRTITLVDDGRSVGRIVHPGTPASFEEQFDFNERGQLTRHLLPTGRVITTSTSRTPGFCIAIPN
jgi:hypothetical protein